MGSLPTSAKVLNITEAFPPLLISQVLSALVGYAMRLTLPR